MEREEYPDAVAARPAPTSSSFYVINAGPRYYRILQHVRFSHERIKPCTICDSRLGGCTPRGGERRVTI